MGNMWSSAYFSERRQLIVLMVIFPNHQGSNVGLLNVRLELLKYMKDITACNLFSNPILFANDTFKQAEQKTNRDI